MRLVFFGSGAFGVPTLERLAGSCDLAAVVTQPDRRSGRGKRLTPTPIGVRADALDLPTIKADSVNAPDVRDQIRALDADAWVVIAFGQKLGRSLLEGVFAVNLHASLLPRWRGAAPIQHAILAGDEVTGNSVIALADRMDAGEVYAQSRHPIEPEWTAGELHDMLAGDGPDLVEGVLDAFRVGRLEPRSQDESLVTAASRLAKSDAWVDFTESAREAQRRIHGLTPWPGVAVFLGSLRLGLCRVEVVDDISESPEEACGRIDADGVVVCRVGKLRLLEVQPAGKRLMAFADFARGRPIRDGDKLRSSES
ncbi:MAG: methionyl-tRNA formyltransferase [Phycisphaerales bacterium]|nr:methionyl-tRNA formyltransferase [Phycisphaerales bacterium]